MTLIAELRLDLDCEADRIAVRLFAPERLIDGPGWRCRYEIDELLDSSREAYGESSLQAIVLAIKALSSDLYGSEAYVEGRLGVAGELGGYLGIPAPHVFAQKAPFPF